MSRMAGHMDFLVRNDPFVSTRAEGASGEDDERRVIGRSWMRLAASVAHTGHDPYAVASEWLPNIWLDLRYIDGTGPNTAEHRGLVIPTLSPDADRSLPFTRRGWRDDRYGERKPYLVGGDGVSLSGTDEETNETDTALSAALDVLTAFGHMTDQGDETEKGPERLARDNAVIAALAGIGGAAFGDEREKARSMEIAKAFRRSLAQGSTLSLPLSEGTTAGLLERLVNKQAIDAPTKNPQRGVTILDGIGVSEAARADGRAEDVYARLLEPFQLVVSKAGADEIYSALQAEFPWMKEANQMVAIAVARTERQKLKHWRLPPTLIVGPPGTGKTRWIRRVSEMTGVPTHMISLSGVSHSKSIIGSERGWASARPSFMAYGFMGTLVGNPIFHVDELDKTGSNTYDANVQEAFLPILERETYRKYPDMYLLGNMDLGWSTFLFSANDLSKVSPVLLTRLQVLHVQKPSVGDVGKIIATMVDEVCHDENFTEDEIGEIRKKVEAKAHKVFVASGNLRDVQRHVENEVKDFIWKPRGPRLVTG